MVRMPTEAGASRVTVVLIEDYAKIRAMIKEILESDADFQVIGQTADGLTGYDMVLTLRPHVVVIDLGLWQFKGISATHRLKTLAPEITIIGISAHLDEIMASSMLGAGADACVAKHLMVDDLVPTIRKVRRTTVEDERVV